MTTTLEELYSKCDEITQTALNVSVIDHFVFDLSDENSQKSLKSGFPGIETVIIPENGKYLVVESIVENKDILVLISPSKANGKLGLMAYNISTKRAKDILGEDCKDVTLDDFTQDFACMEEVAKRFTEFAFGGDDGENSANEVKNIGSYDVSNDEPVEIMNNTITTDNEETEMKFKPIEEDTDELNDDKNTKWVEISSPNAIEVTEDDAAAPAEGQEEDPFADAAADATATDNGNEGEAAPAEGDAAPAEGDATADAPAEGDATAADATAADATATIEDPKEKMRELLAYYTNYMTELVKDPNTSTELISATQEMIDSLIKNMESADGIEEVKAETEQAAAEEVTANEAPAEDATEEVSEATNEQVESNIDAEIDELHKDDWEDIQPVASDNILTPAQMDNIAISNTDISDVQPSLDEEISQTPPDENIDLPVEDDLDIGATDLPTDDDALYADDGLDDILGPDGLPIEKFDGDVDALANTTPSSKKIQWSSDYAISGVATSDDNSIVVPEVLTELGDYYKKVADEVSKVPGKEDVVMKLQKIQILSDTIRKEWDGILSKISDTCVSAYDRDNMSDLEKDELDSVDALEVVGQDIRNSDELDEENDLAINEAVSKFVNKYSYLY